MSKDNNKEAPYNEISCRLEIFSGNDLEGIIFANQAYLLLPKISLYSASQAVLSKYYINAASSEEVLNFMNDLEKILSCNGFFQDTADDFVMSMMELIENAQEHTYNFSREKKVEVNIHLYPTHVMGSVISTGQEIDIRKMKNIPSAERMLDTTIRGRGMYMIIKGSDMLYINKYRDTLDCILIKTKHNACATSN